MYDNTDHCCDDFGQRKKTNKPINKGFKENVVSVSNIWFTCGECHTKFKTICVLHMHMVGHEEGGSYSFDHITKTAFPKFDAVCAFTQVDECFLSEIKNLNSKDFDRECDVDEINVENVDIDVCTEDNVNRNAVPVRKSSRLAQKRNPESLQSNKIKKHKLNKTEPWPDVIEIDISDSDSNERQEESSEDNTIDDKPNNIVEKKGLYKQPAKKCISNNSKVYSKTKYSAKGNNISLAAVENKKDGLDKLHVKEMEKVNLPALYKRSKTSIKDNNTADIEQLISYDDSTKQKSKTGKNAYLTEVSIDISKDVLPNSEKSVLEFKGENKLERNAVVNKNSEGMFHVQETGNENIKDGKNKNTEHMAILVVSKPKKNDKERKENLKMRVDNDKKLKDNRVVSNKCSDAFADTVIEKKEESDITDLKSTKQKVDEISASQALIAISQSKTKQHGFKELDNESFDKLSDDNEINQDNIGTNSSEIHNAFGNVIENQRDEHKSKVSDSEILDYKPCFLKNQRYGAKNKLVKQKKVIEDSTDESAKPCPITDGNKTIKNDRKCQVCGKTGTASMISYHRHLHKKDKELTCDICGTGFQSPACLRWHLKTHGAKEFKCDQCPADFHRRQYLQIHMLKHSGLKPHVCETCGKSYRDLTLLKRHIRCSHEKCRKFTCDICGDRFFRADHLKNHRNRHSKAELRCRICAKMFKLQYDLERHVSIHTGEKKCSCQTCGRDFSRKYSYYNHMKKKHNIDKETLQAAEMMMIDDSGNPQISSEFSEQSVENDDYNVYDDIQEDIQEETGVMDAMEVSNPESAANLQIKNKAITFIAGDLRNSLLMVKGGRFFRIKHNFNNGLNSQNASNNFPQEITYAEKGEFLGQKAVHVFHPKRSCDISEQLTSYVNAEFTSKPEYEKYDKSPQEVNAVKSSNRSQCEDKTTYTRIEDLNDSRSLPVDYSLRTRDIGNYQDSYIEGGSVETVIYADDEPGIDEFVIGTEQSS